MCVCTLVFHNSVVIDMVRPFVADCSHHVTRLLILIHVISVAYFKYVFIQHYVFLGFYTTKMTQKHC